MDPDRPRRNGFGAQFYAFLQGTLPFIRKLFSIIVGLLVLSVLTILLLEPDTGSYYLMLFSIAMLLACGIPAGLAIVFVDDPTDGKPLSSFEDGR